MHKVLGQRVDIVDYDEATTIVMRWARDRESRYVCISNVHMIMEGHDDPAFREIVNRADLVTADGMPLVWALKLSGQRKATRVRGPTLMPSVLAAARREHVPVGFLGGTQTVLDALVEATRRMHPNIDIAYAWSPPFRALSATEEERCVSELVASGARIVFVGLGCPKQERWMARLRDRVPAVLIGTGAAFDFLAGTKREAPQWLQAAGLEWLFRLASEPTRLWRRYLRHNPRFLFLLGRELLNL